MLKIGDVRVPLCSGFTRREFLRVGGLGCLGLTLADLFRAEALAQQAGYSGTQGEVRNCIVLFLVGGPSHIDTWDPKPEAPQEIRGPFAAIETAVPGIRIAENFPLMAQRMEKIALVRSLYHNDRPIHESGHQFMMTGHVFQGGQSHPHMGSVLARVFGARSALPANMILPGPIGNTGVAESHGQEAAYLGKGYEPFFLRGDPAQPDFQVADLTPRPPADGGAERAEFRLSARRRLLEELDDLQRRSEADIFNSVDRAYEQAFGLILSPETRRAFDLAEEPPEVRDRYGRNTFGQSCLLARRLIEQGVRMVTVNAFDTVFNIVCWDMHANGGDLNSTLDDYKNILCPQFDVAYTALLDDLEQRGLLDETVVVTLSEMGRTPRLNPSGGRDHWPAVWTNFIAGGPVRGGQVVGSSDHLGGNPHDRPVTPPEMTASIYRAMGINLDTTTMPGPGSRPIRFIEADPVMELFG